MCAQCLFRLLIWFSHTRHTLYIHSFKFGRVGDEELFDVMHFKFTPASLRLKPKGATLLKNPVSVVLQNSLRLSPWLTSVLDALLSRSADWCAAAGIEPPTDLAFYFTSYEEALKDAARDS